MGVQELNQLDVSLSQRETEIQQFYADQFVLKWTKILIIPRSSINNHQLYYHQSPVRILNTCFNWIATRISIITESIFIIRLSFRNLKFYVLLLTQVLWWLYIYCADDCHSITQLSIILRWRIICLAKVTPLFIIFLSSLS